MIIPVCSKPRALLKLKSQDMAGAICYNSCALMTGTKITNFSETNCVCCKNLGYETFEQNVTNMLY